MEPELEKLKKEFGVMTKWMSSTNELLIKNVKNGKMEKNVKDQLRIALKNYGDETRASSGKVLAFGDEVDEATGEVDEFGKKLKGTSVAGGLLKKGLKFLWDATVGLAAAVLKTGIAFGKTSSNIKTLEDAFEHGAAALGPMGSLLGGFAGELDDNIQMFKGLAQSGATFNSSIEEMRDQAYQAGMPLVQFQELIGNNTTTLAKLFGTVNQGIPNIAGMGRELRKFTEKELAGFGITMDETNEFLGTYAELTRARGTQEQMTASQVLKGTKAYAKQLTTLSRLTGESVMELDKQMKQDSVDGVLQAKLAQMSEKDAMAFQAMMKQFPAGARNAVMELGLLESPISDAARGLEALGGGAIKDLIQKRMGGQIDEIEFQNEMRRIAAEMQKGGGAWADAAMASGGGMMKETLDIVAAMKGGKIDREKFDETSASAADGNTAALVNTQSALEMNTVAMQALGTTMLSGLILDNDALGADLLHGFVNDSGKTTDEMRKSVENMTKKMMDKLGGGGSKTKTASKTSYSTGQNRGYGGNIPQYNRGTDGFVNFGSGTPAMLHGVEAVVPKNDISQLTKELIGLGAPVTEGAKAESFGGGFSDAIKAMMEKMQTGGGGGGGNNLSQLVAILNTNADNTAKAADSLNKLVAINMATERNTKNTNKELADMGGSLV